MPRLFKRSRKVDGQTVYGRKWWGEYERDGRTIREPLHTDKGTAQVMLGRLVQEAQEGGGGIGREVRRPLAEHIDEWERHLEARGGTAKHVALAVARARRVIDGCGFKLWGDIQPSRVQAFLASMRVPLGKGKSGPAPLASVQTRNYHLQMLKQFLRWLVTDRRAPHNPLDGMTGGNAQTDRRRSRQALSPDALARLLSATRDSATVYRGLDGEARHLLYLVAVSTGFRAAELASLTPESFRLDDQPPCVQLASKRAKNRKPTQQPLPGEIVPLLHAWVDKRASGEPLWPGTWHERAAEMVYADLSAAGIDREIDGPDCPQVFDFHAFRHTYIANLDRAGATLKQAMALARHSDPRLTMRVYGRAQLADLGAVVDRILTVSPVNSGQLPERKITTDRKIG